MAAYVFMERLDLWDASFRDEYRALAARTTAAHGGKYISVSRDHTLLEGGSLPDVLSLIEFPTREAALQWYHSAEYQKAIKLRNTGSRDRLLLFEAAAPAYAIAAGAV